MKTKVVRKLGMLWLCVVCLGLLVSPLGAMLSRASPEISSTLNPAKA
jgi:hypothetical protein